MYSFVTSLVTVVHKLPPTSRKWNFCVDATLSDDICTKISLWKLHIFVWSVTIYDFRNLSGTTVSSASQGHLLIMLLVSVGMDKYNTGWLCMTQWSYQGSWKTVRWFKIWNWETHIQHSGRISLPWLLRKVVRCIENKRGILGRYCLFQLHCNHFL